MAWPTSERCPQLSNKFQWLSRSHTPDYVRVSPGAEAPRVFVSLVGAHVVLDDVVGRTFFNLHTLVAVRRDRVTGYQVAVAAVQSQVVQLYSTEG